MASAYVAERLHRGRAPTPWPSAYTVAECLRRGRALFYLLEPSAVALTKTS